MARFERNPTFVQDWVAENGAAWQQEMGEAGLAAITEAAPVGETGVLRASGSHAPFTDASGAPSIRFTMAADYARWVDQGTGLYGPMKQWITPSRAQALSWVGPEGRVTVRRTRGQPGQRFFLRGLSAVFSRVDEHRYGDR